MKLKDQVSTNGNDIVYGFAGFALSQEIGAAEVSGRYAMSFYGGYGTRVIQHEMSHIYGCLDHTGTANCIMWYNYTTPGVWCNSHATKIQSNASKW